MKSKERILHSMLRLTLLLAVLQFSQFALGQTIVATFIGNYSGADSGTVKITIDSLNSTSCEFDSSVSGNSPVFHGTGFINSDLSLIEITCSGDIANNVWSAGATGIDGKNIQGSWTHGYVVGTTGHVDSGAFKASLATASGSGSAVSTPQSVSGLWYDPTYSGSGFNFQMSGSGLLVTYYGWDATGNRLWLISDIGPTSLALNIPITLNMTYTVGGTFNNPQRNIAQWGSLTLNFQSCQAATATLSGKDGTQNLNLKQLTGVVGLPGC